MKIYKCSSSADIPCSEHSSFNLLFINSLVASFLQRLHQLQCGIPLFLFLDSFLNILLSTGIILNICYQKRSIKRGVWIIKQKKPHDTLSALWLVKKPHDTRSALWLVKKNYSSLLWHSNKNCIILPALWLVKKQKLFSCVLINKFLYLFKQRLHHLNSTF